MTEQVNRLISNLAKDTEQQVKVIKRDGRIVPFSHSKIYNAIEKAFIGMKENVAQSVISEITYSVLENLHFNDEEKRMFTIEGIQDEVEKQLMKNYPEVAKAYILYREERSKQREKQTPLMKTLEEISYTETAESDLKRENANINSDTAMGSMLKYGSESIKRFILLNILPKDIAKAHIEGDIHIHDLDFYLLTETCCQIDLLKLFHGGFTTGHGYIREPNSITAYASLACIAIQSNQNDQHGGQAIPNFDYAMSEGVKKTFVKEYIKTLKDFIWLVLDIDEKDSEYLKENKKRTQEKVNIGLEKVKNALTEAIKNGETIIDKKEEIIEKTLIYVSEGFEESIDGIYGKEVIDYVWRLAIKHTEQQTYQAMEALIHNLNTMHSRAGAQVPFSSLNYGMCTEPEARMAVKNLLLATEAGLGNGETPIFPIQIFRVKEGINYNEGEPNYDLFKLAMRVSAKRLFPNFSFVDAPFNKMYYKSGHPETEISYMGCRTRVIGNNYDPEREICPGRGNLSFTTINLPRLGILAKGDLNKFYEMLKEKMDLCKQQLLHRFSIQCQKKVKNYPFLMGNGVWIDSDKLTAEDSIAEVLKHGTFSIGFIGLAETLKALIGVHHGESEEAQKLGLEIISFMRKVTDLYSEVTGLNFSLFATPAEGLSGRFIRIDKKKFGEIEGITDRDYYTNSFHVPVYYPISAYNKISIEAPYHALTNAGHISYVELDGDPLKNLPAFEAIIRCMHDKGIGYGSVNHPVDRDPVCGYVGIINDVCPRCGRREGEGVSVEKLNELRKLYPNMPRFCGCE